jgi:hypothetical protein
MTDKKILDTKTVAKKPSKDAKTVAKKPLKDAKKVAKKPLKDAKKVAKKPLKDAKKVAKKPLKDTKTVAKKPLKDTKTVAKKPLKDAKKIAKKPLKDTKTVSKKPSKDTKTVAKKLKTQISGGGMCSGFLCYMNTKDSETIHQPVSLPVPLPVPQPIAENVSNTSLEEPIEESDIMYKDDFVCILKPNVKKGIIVWSNYTQPPNMDSLCELGLKTGKELEKEEVKFGRTKIHPYIFFRAPYYSRDINYTSIETEIKSSYGEEGIKKGRVFIRVNPDETFVFSSELRVVKPDDIYKSKKTLSKYLEIIKNNSIIYNSDTYKNSPNITKGHPVYHLISSKLISVPATPHLEEMRRHNYSGSTICLHSIEPIERNSEILVKLPHLTPNYFVLCT